MTAKIIGIAIILAIASSVQAQVIDPKKTAKRKVENRTNRNIEKTIDKGLDKIEKGIGSIFKKKDNKTQEEKSQTSTPNPAEQKNGNTGINENAGSNGENNQQQTSHQLSSKFDFEPGNKVLYFDDFQRLNIGDFPAEFNTNASGEIVNVNGKPGKWLSMTKNGAFIPENIKELPQNFTLEFEVGILGDPSNNYSGLGLNFTTDKNSLFKENFFSKGSSIVYLHPGGEVASIQIIPSNSNQAIENQIPMPQWSVYGNQFAKVSIWRQNGRLRVYVNENKLLDAPRFFSENKPYSFAFFRRFFYDCEVLITNIRLAIAGEDNRSKLITEGRFVTNGIQFDVNSDVIKPESGPILKEMAQTLEENPTVNIKIIGHTDSDGDANSNLILSKKRAQAVKNALVAYYGISESRMQVDGKGESEPIQPNTTPEGKAQNRRVEFIKL